VLEHRRYLSLFHGVTIFVRAYVSGEPSLFHFSKASSVAGASLGDVIVRFRRRHSIAQVGGEKVKISRGEQLSYRVLWHWTSSTLSVVVCREVAIERASSIDYTP
jgi:hypothetical protein